MRPRVSLAVLLALLLSLLLTAARRASAASPGGTVRGILPYSAGSPDPERSMIARDFRRLKLQTRAGDIELATTAEGLTMFDARRREQPWARAAPVFWCGVSRDLPPGS